jgi:hypothetical protein
MTTLVRNLVSNEENIFKILFSEEEIKKCIEDIISTDSINSIQQIISFNKNISIEDIYDFLL